MIYRGGPDMTAIDATHTLAELVTDHPGLARELERLGLDYCCGANAQGRRSQPRRSPASLGPRYRSVKRYKTAG
jgi:iron-sulfur cluster repair protein YtfE (RIC family)